MKFYTLKNILEKNCIYNLIIGERSNGKTFQILKYIVERKILNNEQGAILRRWKTDFTRKTTEMLFSGINENLNIPKMTGGKWEKVKYYRGAWYFSKYDEELDKDILDVEPIAYSFALTQQEHDKGSSYPKVTTIFFDEFLTRGQYLDQEFVVLMNVISTIVRYRDNVKIFMCGNTVNKYSPYWNEMGLTNVSKMKAGDIDVYTYGDSALRVAIEYADSPNKSKPSDIYFAFNNPHLQMITNGAWEIDIYPHCPCKYLPKDIKFIYLIIFQNDVLQANIVEKDGTFFTYIHRKTTPIKNPDTDLIYQLEPSYRGNVSKRFDRPRNKTESAIWDQFSNSKVFYQDNEVGEIVRNYMNVMCE